MPRATHRSLRRLSDSLLSLQREVSLPELPGVCLETMRPLIGADIYTVDAINQRRMQIVAKTYPELVPEADLRILNAHLHEHPSVSCIREPGPQTVAQWSDFITLRQFRNKALYHDFFRVIGTKYQIAIAFPADHETVFCAVFNRGGKDYSSEDRAMLELLVPHVKRAFNRASAKSEVERVFSYREAAGSKASSALLLAQDGELLYAGEHARELCANYFGGWVAREAPRLLLQWLLAQVQTTGTWIDERGARRLIVRSTGPVRLPASPGLFSLPEPERQGWLLQLHEEHGCQLTPENLRQAFGLTPRESEVLYWIAQGKRSDEIGLIAAMQPRTVEKHTEHLLAKLGVENRSSAAARAWELVRTGE